MKKSGGGIKVKCQHDRVMDVWMMRIEGIDFFLRTQTL